MIQSPRDPITTGSPLDPSSLRSNLLEIQPPGDSISRSNLLGIRSPPHPWEIDFASSRSHLLESSCWPYDVGTCTLTCVGHNHVATLTCTLRLPSLQSQCGHTPSAHSLCFSRPSGFPVFGTSRHMCHASSSQGSILQLPTCADASNNRTNLHASPTRNTSS